MPPADSETERQSQPISNDTINVTSTEVNVDNLPESLSTATSTLPEDALFDSQFVWCPNPSSLDDPSTSGSGALGSDFLTNMTSLTQYLHPSTDVSELSDRAFWVPQMPSTKLPDGPTQVQTVVDSDDQIWQLLDLQERLLGLSRSLLAYRPQMNRVVVSPRNSDPVAPSPESDLSKDMEEIYQATEDLVDVADKIYYHPTQPEYDLDPALEMTFPNHPAAAADAPHQASSRPNAAAGSAWPHVSTVLLFASCYVRLTDVYTLLASVLQQQQQLTSRSPLEALVMTKAGFSKTQSAVPSFHMGKMRLAIPPSMSIKLHFHLISLMVQRLQITMRWCISGVPEEAKCGQAFHQPADSGCEKGSVATLLLKKSLGEVSVVEDGLVAVLQQQGVL
jgi:hypothetical protein